MQILSAFCIYKISRGVHSTYHPCQSFNCNNDYMFNKAMWGFIRRPASFSYLDRDCDRVIIIFLFLIMSSLRFSEYEVTFIRNFFTFQRVKLFNMNSNFIRLSTNKWELFFFKLKKQQKGVLIIQHSTALYTFYLICTMDCLVDG